jgi:hypothetical protein
MPRTVTPLMLLATLLTTACGAPDAPAAPSGIAAAATAATSSAAPNEGALLAEVRAGTARYQRVDAALADGYVRAASCATSVFGGKGYTYQNSALFDGIIDPSAPEMLNYEPAENGRLRLVSVTFLVPASAWDPFHASPPTLGDQAFLDRRLAGSFGPGVAHYALFVSVWRNNPRGMYDQYNPNVSCDFADDAVVELIRATTTGRSVYPNGNTPEGGQGQPIAGLSCVAGTPIYHDHAHLSLFVGGEQIAVPAGVGIQSPVLTNGYVNFDRTKCFYELHTHDASGIIHLHANAGRVLPLTLGQLFAVWGRTLSREDVAGNAGPVVAYVNQQLYTGDLGSIVLSNHTQVTLEVGNPVVKPPTYLFPTNP